MTACRGRLAVAALALTVTGCGRMLPLGPYAPAAPSHLGSPIVVQLVLGQSPLQTGGCAGGSGTLYVAEPDSPQSPGACYQKTGPPVAFTSAAVTLYLQPAGSEPGQRQTAWGLAVTLPAAEAGALTAITAKSCRTKDPLAFSIADTTWAVITTGAPLTNGRFIIMMPSKDEALQVQRTLVPSD
jgi:hypothetical protein